MTRVMLAALAVAFTTVAANAATFKVTKPNPKKGETHTIIFMDGDIEKGDYKEFYDVASKLPAGKVIVSLDSRGGSLVEGIKIGMAIRQMKWITVARDMCASACADIWLAGVERGAFQHSQIGFHSAYNSESGKIENGSGNAITGAYYSKLGFGYDTIAYLTSAKPEEMEWLNPEKAKEYNIKFAYLGPKQAPNNGMPVP